MRRSGVRSSSAPPRDSEACEKPPIEAAFSQVVIDGVRSQNGMVSFARAMTPEDVEAVRAYVVGRAQEAREQSAGAGTPNAVPPQNAAEAPHAR